MDQLTKLKEEYNKKLERNKNAEKWFKEHSVEECMQQLNLFNQVVQELSSLIKQIESMTYRKMTNVEILNGFEV
jgi:response regulator RpfG family c-di-GMP phosphodiesterase